MTRASVWKTANFLIAGDDGELYRLSLLNIVRLAALSLVVVFYQYGGDNGFYY